MKFDVKAMAGAWGILWGGCVLVVAIVNAMTGTYAQQFLDMLSSWYPGYHATHGAGQIVVLFLYALVDGLVGGAIFAWIYNSLLKKMS